MPDKERRFHTKIYVRASESLLIICVPDSAYNRVLHNLKKKMEIAAAMLTFLLNYTNESIRSACAFVAPPAGTLKWSFFMPERGTSERVVLTAARTLTARFSLGKTAGSD